MKKLLISLLLCIAAIPALADEHAGQSTAGRLTAYLKEVTDHAAATPQTETLKEEQVSIGKALDALTAIGDKGQGILPNMTGLKESWTGLKENCTEIKETTVETLHLLKCLTVGLAVFTCLVPILLIVIVLYLRKIDRKLSNSHNWPSPPSRLA